MNAFRKVMAYKIVLQLSWPIQTFGLFKTKQKIEIHNISAIKKIKTTYVKTGIVFKTHKCGT